MTQPICIAHKCSFIAEKNGYTVALEGRDGRVHTYYRTDMYQCPRGGEQVVFGFSRAMYPRRADGPPDVVFDLVLRDALGGAE